MIRRQTIFNLLLCAFGSFWGIVMLRNGDNYGWVPIILTVIVVIGSIVYRLFSEDDDD